MFRRQVMQGHDGRGRRKENEKPADILESEIIGCSHGEIGGKLIDHWKLPPVFSIGAFYHNYPQEAPTEAQQEIAAVGAAAEVIFPAPVHLFGINDAETHLNPEILTMLDLTEYQ